MSTTNLSIDAEDRFDRADDRSASLSLAELEQAVRSTDSAALLVAPRILRRVIRQDRQLAGLRLKVPHHQCYAIPAQRLLEIVEKEELGLEAGQALPDPVILLARPAAEDLADISAGAALIQFWRLLFHARVHAALEQHVARGHCGAGVPPAVAGAGETPAPQLILGQPLSAAAVRRQVYQIGSAAFDEIRAVLRQEGLLLPPRDDATAYVEFAAVYLELKHFAPRLLPHYFSALGCHESIERLLAQDVDAERLLVATRLAGAPDPPGVVREGPGAAADCEAREQEHPLPPERRSADQYRRLTRRAEKAAALGNVVRSLSFRVRADRVAPENLAVRARAAITTDLDHLIHRLQAALGAVDRDPRPWREPLLALARQMARGIWTVERRLLYDLQKVCVDHERGIYKISLVDWVLSLGRRPIKRPLPHQRDLLICLHLQSAARRLVAVEFPDRLRERLSALLRAASEQAETRLRERFRPLVTDTLKTSGFLPQNVPERLALKKLVEEMLDRVVRRGFLTMGDLRDAVSRNNLKMPDLAESRTPGKHGQDQHRSSGISRLIPSPVVHLFLRIWATVVGFFRGDQLLRANRRLARVLEGVYQKGEFYLRWMQRLSALGFGTRWGRFLTRYVVVPFGGSYLVLAFVEHLIEKLAGPAHVDIMAPLGAVLAYVNERIFGPHPIAVATLLDVRVVRLLLKIPLTVVGAGVFLLGLLYVERFRNFIGQVLRTAYHLVRGLLVDLPMWIAQRPLVLRIVRSRPFELTFRFVLKPLAWAVLVRLAIPWQPPNWRSFVLGLTAIFLAMNLLLNSRLGRNAEELVTDWIVQGWQRFGVRLFTGLFWLISDAFRGIVEAVERLLYTVDEWLRFRSGESGVSLVLKGVLGTVWAGIHYVVRFCVNLLIEPQVNPIKHFPVVTVSHKLLWPALPYLASILQLAALAAFGHTLERALALFWAGAIITAIPGIFGFLVWELKENWRLYAANRRPCLGPVMIGSHGENMVRLLKPGFHSGTIPKRFAKLRRAEREALPQRSSKAVRKHLLALDHVELRIRRYVERELLELLAENACWRAAPVAVRQVHVGSNRVRIALGCPALCEGALWIEFEVVAGWLVAGVCADGWISRLLPGQRQMLSDAILGLYKSAGVELVRQQIEAEFPPPAPAYDFRTQGLVVWPGGTFEVEALYALRGDSPAPQLSGAYPTGALPTLQRSRILLREVRVTWQRWVEVWEQTDGDCTQSRDVLAEVRVLPLFDGR